MRWWCTRRRNHRTMIANEATVEQRGASYPTRPLSQTSLVTRAQTLSSAYIRYKRQHAPYHPRASILLSHLKLPVEIISPHAARKQSESLSRPCTTDGLFNCHETITSIHSLATIRMTEEQDVNGDCHRQCADIIERHCRGRICSHDRPLGGLSGHVRHVSTPKTVPSLFEVVIVILVRKRRKSYPGRNHFGVRLSAAVDCVRSRIPTSDLDIKLYPVLASNSGLDAFMHVRESLAAWQVTMTYAW